MLQLPHAHRSAVAAAALVLTVFAYARPVPLPASGRGSVRERLAPVPIGAVVINDDFWAPKIEVWREVTIGDCFAKFERDGALANFDKIRDGTGGDHGGPPWYDGLIYEMIRACADFLAARPDPALEARIDGYIARIAAAAAKDPDGYLNTYTQLKEPTHRWGLAGGNDNWQHDVYNAGAMIEAAVHYYRATGKTSLLAVAAKLANHMCDVMGPPPRRNVVPGHSIGEEAAVKLYRLFKEKPELKKDMPCPIDESRYTTLVEFWIENRGNHEGRKSYEAYGQDHKPVLAQETIEGHAVRATLLCTGLVAAGCENGRADYLAAAQRLWRNMVERRMYVTGGLGAVAGHEGFGPDYILPNDGYLETCAAVGAAFFHHRMLLAFADGRYADELERGLYNGILCGASLSGDSYFYENPLQGGPARRRWSWHGCPCCPPMFLKVMAALPGYVYATDKDGVYVNLFVRSRAKLQVAGAEVALTQATCYPWSGAVAVTIEPASPATFALNLRIPGWCREFECAVNGEHLASPTPAHGYLRIARQWRSGDKVALTLAMPPVRVKAHPAVAANIERVALMRGPLVYCLEGIDNENRVANLVIAPETPLSVAQRPELLGGVFVISGPAVALERADWADNLYAPADKAPGARIVTFTAIPYFANANREPCDMLVWAAETPSRATPAPCPTLAAFATATASHCNRSDTLLALNDQIEPRDSADESIPRFTWWDHRGTREWVQYDFAKPARVCAVEVYFWDETRIQRHCRVPASWRVLYKRGDEWKPVENPSPYAVEPDRFNRVTFTPVETPALRIEARLKPEWSGGILEWRVEEAKP